MARWHYLNSKPFATRFVLAAHYLKECPTVIEIGGFKSPITPFLAHRFEQVVSVDPLIEPKQDERVLHVATDYRHFDFTPYTREDYGLVLMGMDLPFDETLFRLIASAKQVVVEFPKGYAPSRELFETLHLFLDLKVDLKVGLDLSDNDFGDLAGSSPVFKERELYVLHCVSR